jgi:RNA polymerase sigma-70 factor (ECF subfamily)
MVPIVHWTVYPADKSGRTLSVSAAAIHPHEGVALSSSGRTGMADARDEEENRLIARCLLGETEAFRPLVLAHQRMAFSISLRMLGSRADAEDVVQQAFLDAFNALGRFRGEDRAHAFSTWLVRIVVNRSKDVLKSKRRKTEGALEAEDVATSAALFAHQPSSPDETTTRDERRRQLEAALLAVPPKYREVLILKDIEELSYEEIRRVLRLPITTLKIRVVRARAMMREALGERQESP